MKIIVSFILTFSLAFAAEWSYEDQDAWGDEYPLCAGKQQTPINIEAGNAICDISTLNIAYLNDPIKAVTVKF
jgi:carbonic anhydrase